MCNSSSSRLLGFFTALPAVWRLLQCARRYYDTRAAFPHLFNLAKVEACTITFNKTTGVLTFTVHVERLSSNVAKHVSN